MSVTLTIQAQPRDAAKNKGTGTRVARKLRKGGQVPAILYGHKEPNRPLTLTRDDVWAMIRRKSHITNLTVDGQAELALVRHIQWDHLGKEVIHLDFARVRPDELILTSVPVTLKGDAPAGGLVEILMHEIKLDCRADSIPDSVQVDVGGLEIGQVIHARELTLPPGSKYHGDPEAQVLHLVSRTAMALAAPVAEATPQPEVIEKGKKEKGADPKAAKAAPAAKGAAAPAAAKGGKK